MVCPEGETSASGAITSTVKSPDPTISSSARRAASVDGTCAGMPGDSMPNVRPCLGSTATCAAAPTGTRRAASSAHATIPPCRPVRAISLLRETLYCPGMRPADQIVGVNVNDRLPVYVPAGLPVVSAPRMLPPT